MSSDQNTEQFPKYINHDAFLAAMVTVKPFMAPDQFKWFERFSSPENEDCQNIYVSIAELAENIEFMPKAASIIITNDKDIVFLHYLKDGFSAYIMSKDCEDGNQLLAFGLSNIGSTDPSLDYAEVIDMQANKVEFDRQFISIVELQKKGFELNLDFKPLTFGELKEQLHQKSLEQTPAPATQEDFQKVMQTIKSFMSPNQFKLVDRLAKGEERQFFYDKIVELSKTIESMPKTYEQDGMGDQAIAYLHYLKNGCDFHITEKDSEDEQHQACGLAKLGYGAELGYISITELQENNVELDFHFKPTTIAELKSSSQDDQRMS